MNAHYAMPLCLKTRNAGGCWGRELKQEFNKPLGLFLLFICLFVVEGEFGDGHSFTVDLEGKISYFHSVALILIKGFLKGGVKMKKFLFILNVIAIFPTLPAFAQSCPNSSAVYLCEERSLQGDQLSSSLKHYYRFQTQILDGRYIYKVTNLTTAEYWGEENVTRVYIANGKLAENEIAMGVLSAKCLSNKKNERVGFEASVFQVNPPESKDDPRLLNKFYVDQERFVFANGDDQYKYTYSWFYTEEVQSRLDSGDLRTEFKNGDQHYLERSCTKVQL